MPSYDVRINEVGYNFGPRGGISPGRTLTDPGTPSRVGTIAVPSFHHGPGQTIYRDQSQYYRGSKVDTTRMGAVLPAGTTTLEYSHDTARFDGLHGANFCQINSKLFIVQPEEILELTHGDPSDSAPTVRVKEGADSWVTLTAGVKFTGSWARWRGKVIFGTERAAAGGEILGGDSSARYALSKPIIYDIATNVFSELAVDAWEYASFLVSSGGTLWWIQNRGMFAAPQLYWTDDTETDFGAITEANTYGPFRVEQGGYCTWLHMVGPHILIFKRDGAIIGVDQSKIWTNYTPERGFLEDDLFGHGVIQYMANLAVLDKSGALMFSPTNLELQSMEPSTVQSYPSIADDNFMGNITTMTVRNPHLYAFGTSPNGTVLYVGAEYANEGFFFASDHGVYAAPTTPPTGTSFKVRSSKVRGTANHRLRAPVAGTTYSETPRACTVYHHGGTHSHLYVAHQGDSDSKLKVYKIDITDPGWRYGPPVVAAGELYTSRLAGTDQMAGSTKIPLQVRGWAAVEGGTLSVSLGVDEGSPTLVGTLTSTGAFGFKVPELLRSTAGRTLTVKLSTPADADFRLECPLFVDFLYTPEHDDAITVSVVVGEIPDNMMGMPFGAGRLPMEDLLDLHNSATDLEFAWGAVWPVWIEQVSVKQLEPEQGRGQGTYLVQLQCRRLD